MTKKTLYPLLLSSARRSEGLFRVEFSCLSHADIESLAADAASKSWERAQNDSDLELRLLESRQLRDFYVRRSFRHLILNVLKRSARERTNAKDSLLDTLITGPAPLPGDLDLADAKRLLAMVKEMLRTSRLRKALGFATGEQEAPTDPKELRRLKKDLRTIAGVVRGVAKRALGDGTPDEMREAFCILLNSAIAGHQRRNDAPPSVSNELLARRARFSLRHQGGHRERMVCEAEAALSLGARWLLDQFMMGKDDRVAIETLIWKIRGNRLGNVTDTERATAKQRFVEMAEEIRRAFPDVND